MKIYWKFIQKKIYKDLRDVGFFVVLFLLALQVFDATAQFHYSRKLINKALKICSDSAKNQNFSGCHFNKNISFESKQFDHYANFDYTVFNGYADFEESSPDKGISFRHAVFNQDFSIYRLDLPSSTDFDSAVFKGEARFERMIIPDTLNLSNCTFNGKVSFSDMGLTYINFSNLHLDENTQFVFYNTGAKVLDFSFNPKIYNEIRLLDEDFTVDPYTIKKDTSKPAPRCLINLYKSDISKFYLDYLNFKLYFPKYLPNSYGDSVEINPYEKQVIYEGLLNNFKNHDQLDSYKLLDIEYQEFKYDNAGHPFYKWLDHAWWNYGYDKEYIFYWTFGFLLFFTFINFFCMENLNKNIYLIESMPDSFPTYQSFNSISNICANLKAGWNRMWFALVYTTAIFFKVTIKIENFQFRHKTGTFYIFLIYIFGLVCLAYMANFVLQK